MTIVLRGNVEPASVGVAAGLDGDAVVSRVEGAVLYETSLQDSGSQPSLLGTVGLYAHAADGDVGAEHGLIPTSASLTTRTPLDTHVLAALGLYELRADVLTLAEDALADGAPRSVISFERLARLQLLGVPFFQRVAPDPSTAHQWSSSLLPSSVPVPVIADVLLLEGVMKGE